MQEVFNNDVNTFKTGQSSKLAVEMQEAQKFVLVWATRVIKESH